MDTIPSPGMNQPPPSRLVAWFSSRSPLPWVILAICLAVTYQLWAVARQEAERDLRRYFDFRVRQSISSVEHRMQTHEQVLRGVLGLFKSSINVERDEFRTYVETLKLEDHYPGIQGVGFSLIIQPHELKKHIAAIREEGFPEYTVRPEGVRALYTSIIYLEPFFGRNLRAFGYDMYSEFVRRAAMARARDEAIPTISHKVRLVQEAETREQAGFLMYIPFYRNGFPHSTLAERRANIVGWVYSPFRMDDLMAGILGERAADLDIEIYDGAEISETTLMYDSDDHRHAAATASDSSLEASNRIQIGGHQWTIMIRALHPLESRIDTERPELVAVIGVAASLLLTLVTWLLAHGRTRAIKAAQEMNRELIETEARFRLMADSAPVLIWLAGDDGKRFWFNKVWLEFTGKEIGDQVSSGWMDGMHPDDLKRFAEISESAFENRSPFRIEYRLKRHDGEYRWVLDSGLPRHDDNGRFIGYIGSLIDVTDRKEMEDALREAEQRWSFALEGAGDGVWDWDVQEGRITFSHRWKEMLGYSDGEIGNSLDEWKKRVHPDDLPGVMAKIRDYCDGKTSTYVSEHRMLCKNGEWKWFLDRGKAVSFAPDGKPLRMVGTHADITGRIQVAEALRQAKEEAESATKIKDKFVSLVSHDLKSPLSTIIGLLRMVQSEGLGQGAEPSGKMIHAATQSAEKMQALIENLLNMSRLRSGAIKPAMMFVSPYSVVEEALSILRETAKAKDVEMTNDVPATGRIYADPLLLIEVIRNLVNNALKFSHPGGSVSIFIPPGRPSTISVADNGIGIPQDALKRLFSYEEKTSTPGTSGESGAGLGLPLSRDMMEAMGGQIAVESDPGKGSVFYASLPYTRPCVLVVDADPGMTMMIKTILGRLDADVMTAFDGNEALTKISERRPDLIISDLITPELEGLALIKKIPKEKSTAATPLIALTAAGDNQSRDAALRNGASDFVTKPFDADELALRVRRFIG